MTGRVVGHAKYRSKQRYDLQMNRETRRILLATIRDGESRDGRRRVVAEAPDRIKGRVRMVVQWDEEFISLVYSCPDKNVITFLPARTVAVTMARATVRRPIRLLQVCRQDS